MKYYGLFLILMAWSNVLNAQTTEIVDSILSYSENIIPDTSKVDYLLDRVWEYKGKDIDVSFAVLEKVIQVQEEMEAKYRTDVPVYYYGVLYRQTLEFEKSEQYYFQYYEMNKLENNPRKMAAVKLALTNLYSDQDLYEKGMKTAKEALELYEIANDTLNCLRTLRKISSIMANTYRLEDGLEYILRAKELALKFGHKAELADVMGDIGIVYEKMGLQDSMFHYYSLYYEMARELDHKQLLIYSSYNLAIAHQDVKEYDLSIFYARQCMAFCKEVKNVYMGQHARVLLGILYVHIGKVDKGISFLNGMLDEVKSNTKLKQDLLNNLYTAYKKKGDINRALEYHEKFKTLSDSLLNMSIAEQVSKLEVQLESSRKENEITLLNTENQLIELKLSRIGRERWLLILGSIALLSIIGLLYRMIRDGQTNRKTLEEKNRLIQTALQDKETLLKEIHHRVKNNLQVISSLLSLQSRQIDDPTAQKAIKEGRNRVKSMALIHQNLYQDEDLVGVNVAEYINRLSKSLVNSYQLEKKVGVVTEIDNVKLDIDQIIPLGLILNELISNALKYAFDPEENGEISIKLKTAGDHINVSVIDNGKGLPEDFDVEQLNSLGYKLVRSFAQKLKANFEIVQQEVGTEIKLTIPTENAA